MDDKDKKSIERFGFDGARKGAGGELAELARRFKQQPLVFTGTVLVLALVIVAFVLLPMDAAPWGSGALSGDALTFGSYDGVPIELTPDSYFIKVRQNYIDFYANSYGWRGESAEMPATRQAFQSAAIRTAIFEAAKAARYSPPKALVDKAVAALPKYQEGGVFSVLRYRQESAARHAETIRDVREDMIIRRYQSDAEGAFAGAGAGDAGEGDAGVFVPAIKASSREKDFIAAMARRERSFSLVSFPYADYPDAELVAYTEKNPDAFKNTELSQITITSGESEAASVLASIKSGATSFEDAAKAYSKDSFASGGGDGGQRMAYQFDSLIPSADDRSAVINLPAGELSGVVKTSAGWAIFRAESAARAPDMADAGVLSSIRSHLVESERAVIEDWLIARAGAFAADAEALGLAAASRKHDVTPLDFGPVPINYGDNSLFGTLSNQNVANAELRAAARSENFWRTAFSLSEGTASAPFVIDASLNSVVVLFLREEAADDGAAADKARAAYVDDFIPKDVQGNFSIAVLKSPKFKDYFTARYAALFTPENAPPSGD
ncbi:MAG: peptidyl-prolyl cis-trans isomerase [Spirochaetaceae bacterium]|jgi:hypothetical protein|nr:peptidyl-prolyl cis-trans isomerase [Spirochaetaceae bacterium]